MEWINSVSYDADKLLDRMPIRLAYNNRYMLTVCFSRNMSVGAWVSAENLSDSAAAAYQQMEAEKMSKTEKTLLTMFARLKVLFIPH
jgi:hypothetical protein